MALSDDQKAIIELCRRFGAETIRPAARSVDESDTETPWEFWRAAARVGITGFMLPSEYGGGGFIDVFTQCLVQEELSAADAAIGNLLTSGGFFADPVLELGDGEQKERCAPAPVRGRPTDDGFGALTSCAMTSPDLTSPDVTSREWPSGGTAWPPRPLGRARVGCPPWTRSEVCCAVTRSSWRTTRWSPTTGRWGTCRSYTAGAFCFPTGSARSGTVPAGLGAALAHPGRQVVALSGDGGLMFSVQELAAVAAEQVSLPVVVFCQQRLRRDQGADEGGGHGARRRRPTRAGLAALAAPWVATVSCAPAAPGRARSTGGAATCRPDPARCARGAAGSSALVVRETS